MGGGRAPCCDKSKVRRGSWSPAEDLRLITYIHKYGHPNWRALPIQAGLLRCGKSCRLRWINYLRPDVKRGNFTTEEEDTIIKLHNSLGNKWSQIASHLPGRTDNEIKNVWNTHLKKRLVMKDADIHKDEEKESSSKVSSSSSPTSVMSYEDQNNKGLEDHVVNGHGTVVSGQCTTPTTNEPKAASTSSFSISSNGSNFSNSSQLVDISRPIDEMSSLFINFEGACEVDDHDKATHEATDDHQEISDQVIEIPWEPDINFWDELDYLDSLQCSEPQQHELEPSQSSKLGEKHTKEVECSQLGVRYLENELGDNRVGITGEEHQHNPLNNIAADHKELFLTEETMCDDMVLMPELDQGIAYFPMWPSSPKKFGVFFN